MYISLIIDYVVNYHVKIILEISNNELLFYEYFRNLDEIEHLSYFKFKYFLTRAKKKKSYLLLILSPIITVPRNHVLAFYLRRNKGEAIRIRIRFRFRFIETSCLLPLQIKVSAGKLLFRLARNHLPFHYFPCPLHSAPFHASLSRIFLFRVDRDHPSLPPSLA